MNECTSDHAEPVNFGPDDVLTDGERERIRVNLRRIRLSRSMSRRQLARGIVSERTLWAYETGNQAIPVSHAVRLARRLGVPGIALTEPVPEI